MKKLTYLLLPLVIAMSASTFATTSSSTSKSVKKPVSKANPTKSEVIIGSVTGGVVVVGTVVAGVIVAVRRLAATKALSNLEEVSQYGGRLQFSKTATTDLENLNQDPLSSTTGPDASGFSAEGKAIAGEGGEQAANQAGNTETLGEIGETVAKKTSTAVIDGTEAGFESLE